MMTNTNSKASKASETLDTPALMRPVRSAKFQAGHETAMADFRNGRFHMPSKRDNREWADGYCAAVEDLGGTFGREKIARMCG